MGLEVGEHLLMRQAIFAKQVRVALRFARIGAGADFSGAEFGKSTELDLSCNSDRERFATGLGISETPGSKMARGR